MTVATKILSEIAAKPSETVFAQPFTAIFVDLLSSSRLLTILCGPNAVHGKLQPR